VQDVKPRAKIPPLSTSSCCLQKKKSRLVDNLFKTAMSDYDAAKKLWETGFYEQCLFYLEQAFEKANKSIYAHMAINLKSTDDLKVEKQLRKSFSHNNKYSAYAVLKELLDAERWQKEQSGNLDRTQFEIGYTFAEGHRQSRQQYKIEQFCDMVKYYYSIYQVALQEPRLQHPASAVLVLNWALSSSLEEIESRARYPLSEYRYDNVEKLKAVENKDCYLMLLVMVRDYVNRTPDLIAIASQRLAAYYRANPSSTKIK
jgi:HEPN domain-containing protein